MATAYARAARLDEEELADWRDGRDTVYQLAALTIGAPRGRRLRACAKGQPRRGRPGFSSRTIDMRDFDHPRTIKQHRSTIVQVDNSARGRGTAPRDLRTST
jgi:hypothetical protein